LHSVGAAQATSEAADLYFDGFQAFKAGESLEQAGKIKEAREKYKIAEEKIAAVQKEYPNWQREVVEYRLNVIRKKLAGLESRSQSATPAPAPAPLAPAIPSVKPPEMFFKGEKIPFTFNGETFYKMLPSHSSAKPAAPQR
jgi:hypothetical protein